MREEALTNDTANALSWAAHCWTTPDFHRSNAAQGAGFCLDSHRKIFGVIEELANGGKAVDDLTVTNALIGRGQLESVGGAAYVTSLSEKLDMGVARVTHVEHYAQLVLDKSRRRRAHAAAQSLLFATEDPLTKTEDCLAGIQEALLNIEAATAGKGAPRQGSAREHPFNSPGASRKQGTRRNANRPSFP